MREAATPTTGAASAVAPYVRVRVAEMAPDSRCVTSLTIIPKDRRPKPD